jgi:hypothetical protein
MYPNTVNRSHSRQQNASWRISDIVIIFSSRPFSTISISLPNNSYLNRIIRRRKQHPRFSKRVPISSPELIWHCRHRVSPAKVREWRERSTRAVGNYRSFAKLGFKLCQKLRLFALLFALIRSLYSRLYIS